MGCLACDGIKKRQTPFSQWWLAQATGAFQSIVVVETVVRHSGGEWGWVLRQTIVFSTWFDNQMFFDMV